MSITSINTGPFSGKLKVTLNGFSSASLKRNGLGWTDIELLTMMGVSDTKNSMLSR